MGRKMRENASGSVKRMRGWGGSRKGAGAKKRLNVRGQKNVARYYRRRARIRRQEHELLPRAPKRSEEYRDQQEYLRTMPLAERAAFAERESHTDEREKIALRKSGRTQAEVSAIRKRRKDQQRRTKQPWSSDLYMFREPGGWQRKAIEDTVLSCQAGR